MKARKKKPKGFPRKPPQKVIAPRSTPSLATVAAESAGLTPIDDLFRKPGIAKFGRVEVLPDKVVVREFHTDSGTPEQLRDVVMDWAIAKLIETRRFFSPKPDGIDKYVASVRHAMKTDNWFGGLFIAVALPDICAAIENKIAGVGDRYRDWFGRYLTQYFPPSLFTAEDCYQLRCKALHQGLSHDVNTQRLQFVLPDPQIKVHQNFWDNGDGTFTLQLQLDIFCELICRAVEQWKSDVAGDAAIQKRIAELLEFKPIRPQHL